MATTVSNAARPWIRHPCCCWLLVVFVFVDTHDPPIHQPTACKGSSSYLFRAAPHTRRDPSQQQGAAWIGCNPGSPATTNNLFHWLAVDPWCRAAVSLVGCNKAQQDLHAQSRDHSRDLGNRCSISTFGQSLLTVEHRKTVVFLICA